MAIRKKMGFTQSKKQFKRNANKTHWKNGLTRNPLLMRGGTRL